MATSPEQPNHDDGSFPSVADALQGDTGAFPAGASQASESLLFRRYRVVRELGRGGMGVVMLAHDTALDIPVAVKLVPDLVVKDTEAVADLRKEVLRGMALMNPGIVRTHNFEKDEGGAGIVMEYIEGNSLAELKVNQPNGCFDPGQVLPWIEQLCSVLDYAHRDARIVHRDLKPRNIMITRDGRLKVADFGIAAQLSDTMSRHSMEGISSGTLCYMSPQQALGKRPTELDDIHALGATIYELLTSKPPFFRGNHPAIYQQLLSVTPPSMAERRAEFEIGGKSAIPERWEEVVASCLAKEPVDRPKSAGEVYRQLADGLSQSAPKPGPPPLVPPVPSAAAAVPVASPPVFSSPPPSAPAFSSTTSTSPRPAPTRSNGPLFLILGILAAGFLLVVALAAGFYFASSGPQKKEVTNSPSTSTPLASSTPVPERRAQPTPAPVIPAPSTPKPFVEAAPPPPPPAAPSFEAQVAQLHPVTLPAPSFTAFSSGPHPVKKLALKQASVKQNAITDDAEWFAHNGLSHPDITPGDRSGLPAAIPREMDGMRLTRAFPSGGGTLLLFSPRFLVGVDKASRPLFAFDFASYAFSPKTKDRSFSEQDLTSAAVVDDILYVAHGHRTYAKDSGGQNAYISAYSLSEQKMIWCSRPLVCNSNNFLVIGDVIVSGYGFTAEPDFLYQLNRWTGEVLDTIPVKSGPDYILKKGSQIFVRTYNLDYVFDCPE